MKYEDFNRQINELHVNLTNQLENKHEHFVNLQNEIVEKLKSNIIQEKESLSLLEASLFQNEEEKNQHISSIKSIITHLKGELENDLYNKKAAHNAKEYQERLIGQREEKLSSVISPKKKEIENLKQKINTLDRECLLNLKAKALEYEEEEKNVKNKISELERRLRSETQKISDAILIPVKSNIENTGTQPITDTEEIKTYRLKGLKDISNLKTKYYNDVRQAELNFIIYENKFHRDNDIIREQYNLKIADIKYLIDKRQIEIQAEYDIYDVDTYMQVSQYDMDYNIANNNIKREYQKRIQVYQDNIIKADLEKESIRSQNTVSVLSEISEIDKHQLLDFSTIDDDFEASFINFKITLSSTLDLYQEILVNLINEYWLIYSSYIKKFANLLMMSNYNSFTLNNFTYEKNLREIKKYVNSFGEVTKQKSKDYINLVNKWFKDMNDKVKELYQMHLRYLNERDGQFKVFVKNLEKLIVQAMDDGSAHQKEVNKNAIQVVEQKRISYISESNNLLNEISAEELQTKESFNDISKKLNNNIEEIKQKKIQAMDNLKLEYLQNLKYIKGNIAKIKLKAKKDLKAKEKQIKEQYDNEIREVENERKAKIKIGLS